MLALLDTLTADDLVIALISGGGSALLPAPADGITLAEKAEVNRLLLASGADITEMNLIRQQLSRLKGGGFARLAAPHPVTALILSDVIGDDLRAIASGPTTEALGTAQDAIARLKERGLWEKVPASVRTHLEAAPAPATLPPVTNRLVGSNGQSLAAMVAATESARVIPAPIVGDVADAARAICDAAGSGITLWGGETTVRIKGTGLGGRNQELALRLALEAERRAVDRATPFAPSGWRNLRTQGQRHVWLEPTGEHLHVEYAMRPERLGDGSTRWTASVWLGPWPEPDDDGALSPDDRIERHVRLLERRSDFLKLAVRLV